jgi:hypothetical protein
MYFGSAFSFQKTFHALKRIGEPRPDNEYAASRIFFAERGINTHNAIRKTAYLIAYTSLVLKIKHFPMAQNL